MACDAWNRSSVSWGNHRVTVQRFCESIFAPSIGQQEVFRATKGFGSMPRGHGDMERLAHLRGEPGTIHLWVGGKETSHNFAAQPLVVFRKVAGRWDEIPYTANMRKTWNASSKAAPVVVVERAAEEAKRRAVVLFSKTWIYSVWESPFC